MDGSTAKSPVQMEVVEVKQEELSYEEKLENVSVIAKPMASKKLAKKIYKLIKKGMYVQFDNSQQKQG